MPGVDPRILGYLGRALSMELSAVQNYSTQARLAHTWGLDEAARRFKQEAVEEQEHVDRIIGRMLALGVAPNGSILRPAGVGASLKELLAHDHAFEQELMNLYAHAADHAARIGDADSRLFFQGLLEEERDHAREMSQWMAELENGAPR